MAAFSDVGSKCTFCGRQDYLPFTCEGCNCSYCDACFRLHQEQCPELEMIERAKQLSIAERAEQHELLRSSLNFPRCSACNIKLEAKTSQYHCPLCSKLTCIKHRFEGDHECFDFFTELHEGCGDGRWRLGGKHIEDEQWEVLKTVILNGARDEKKYHTLKKTNAKLRQNIFSNRNAVAILKALGFVDQGQELVLEDNRKLIYALRNFNRGSGGNSPGGGSSADLNAFRLKVEGVIAVSQGLNSPKEQAQRQNSRTLGTAASNQQVPMHPLEMSQQQRIAGQTSSSNIIQGQGPYPGQQYQVGATSSTSNPDPNLSISNPNIATSKPKSAFQFANRSEAVKKQEAEKKETDDIRKLRQQRFEQERSGGGPGQQGGGQWVGAHNVYSTNAQFEHEQRRKEEQERYRQQQQRSGRGRGGGGQQGGGQQGDGGSNCVVQ